MILLRDDVLDFNKNKQEEESRITKDSFDKSFYKKSNEKQLSSTKQLTQTNSTSFIHNNAKGLESQNQKINISRMKNSPLIFSAENILKLKNTNADIFNNKNELKEYENYNIMNNNTNLNKLNRSQDLKNIQNEYWQKRRSEPYIFNSFSISNNNYLNNNLIAGLAYENSNFFNDSVNNDINNINFQGRGVKESIYRSSELQLRKAIIEKNKFEELKGLNDKKMEVYRHQKKIDFKNDVIVNRKKMDVIESAINKMVVQATHKAKDNMDLFMYNSSKDDLITIEKY